MRFGLLICVSLIAGCGAASSEPSKSGAESTARVFHEALITRDWPKAYAQLAPETRRRISADQFQQLAQFYRKQLEFEPTKVQVRSCEERDAEATAHITLLGTAVKQRFRDAVLLKQIDSEWRVVLPKNFGQATRK